MNTTLRADTHAVGGLIPFLMTEQVSDNTGAAALLYSMPFAAWVLDDRGQHTASFKEVLRHKGLKQ